MNIGEQLLDRVPVSQYCRHDVKDPTYRIWKRLDVGTRCVSGLAVSSLTE